MGNIITNKTLVLIVKNQKVIKSELKNKNYFKDYYNKNPKFLSNVNLLLKQCDEIWFIYFDEFSVNKLEAIRYTSSNTEGSFINSNSIGNCFEFYNVLKKDTSENSKIFLDNIIWWFDVDSFVEKLKPKIQKKYDEFKKDGTALIYDYDYNSFVSISLYKTSPISKYENPIYYIRFKNNISETTKTLYEGTRMFSVKDIIDLIYKYFEDNNYFDENTIKKLIQINEDYLEENRKAKEIHDKLPTWIIDYRDSDGDVGSFWVKAKTKNEAILEFREDYSNEIIRIYQS